MPNRKDTHNRKVGQIVRELSKQGWNVQADLKGYDSPPNIGKGNHVPDVFATMGGKTRIVEVDTPGTENSDQLSAFRRNASQRQTAEFEHVITKPRK